MIEGSQDGTSATGLTVDTAADALDRMFSGKTEEKQPDVARSQEEPKKRTPAPEETDDDTSEPDDDEGPESSESDAQADDDDESDETTESQLRKYRVKVDGEELEVPEDELVKGYSRTQDYTRKTQQLAESRKAFESEQTGVRAEREKLAVQLTQLSDALQSMTPAEPDWDKLRVEDPEAFAGTYAAWQLHKERMETVKQAQADAIQKVVADRQADLQKVVDAEKAMMVEAIPEWKNPETAKKESTALREYATKQGFKDEDLNNIIDHRVYVMLRKAMLFDKAQAEKPALEEKIESVRSATPGASDRNKPKISETTRAKQRLAKTGRVEDAALAIQSLFD
jgi:hypothetical protein